MTLRQKPNENTVIEYFQSSLSASLKEYHSRKTLSLHHGLYEDGVKTFEEAAINMNSYLGKLLKLNSNEEKEILDVGSGIGGTSIYFAKTYPNSNFIGIDLVEEQIEIAKNYAKNQKNLHFFVKNCINTNFNNDKFHGIFAIESMVFLDNKSDFISEMSRIIKPNGRLVVIDCFLKDVKLNNVMKQIYNLYIETHAVSNIITVKEFEKILSDRGFDSIRVLDITRQTYPDNRRQFIIGAPFFLLLLFKRIFKIGNKEPNKDIIFILGSSILGLLLGIKGVFGFYAVTADKK